MQAKILYASNSGNTQHLAELLHEELVRAGITTSIENIRGRLAESLDDYDLVLLGTFTRGEGDLPRQWKQYLSKGMYKHKNVAVFGTGDTQWGNNYCGACDILKRWYDGSYDVLRIEHYPDETQVSKVKKWIQGIIVQLMEMKGEVLR